MDETCGYVGRMLTLTTATIAIVLGIIASSNCNFLKFKNNSEEPWQGLESPFDGSLEAYVGIFSYEIINATNADSITDGCVAYDEKFGKSNFEAMIAAQFCAIFAPTFGILALLVSCVDTCMCRFCCSFLISSALFLAACGIQAGTFSLFAQPDFCINGDQSCNVGISVYLSGVSSALYFCACLFLCCFPTPDPLFGKHPTKKRPSPSEQQKVVIQPIVINQTGGSGYGQEMQYNEEYDDEELNITVPKKKSSIISQNGDKITDDDFNFKVPIDESDRMDVKEVTLPDGTRQVEETTYHADGRKSKKTRKYDQ